MWLSVISLSLPFYDCRAIDYHRKKDTIHKLRKKAAFRNPDEFYFKMNSSKTEVSFLLSLNKLFDSCFGESPSCRRECTLSGKGYGGTQ